MYIYPVFSSYLHNINIDNTSIITKDKVVAKLEVVPISFGKEKRNVYHWDVYFRLSIAVNI